MTTNASSSATLRVTQPSSTAWIASASPCATAVSSAIVSKQSAVRAAGSTSAWFTLGLLLPESVNAERLPSRCEHLLPLHCCRQCRKPLDQQPNRVRDGGRQLRERPGQHH